MPNRSKCWKRNTGKVRILASAAVIVIGAALCSATGAKADALEKGDAVLSGFSGTKAADTKSGGDPLDETFIDLDGASMQIHKLKPDGPPDGQVISAPVTFEAKASDVGQVFAIGLDESDGVDSAEGVPNIYLGATSAFGIQIVIPDSDGDGRPERVKKGHPNAEWMPGQFGPDGGPGSIWKVDGKSGSISLFATIPGNTGAGIGDIVYDRATRQFFVSDLDTGLIHRLSGDGTPIDVFDHGEAGRKAEDLSEVPDDGKVMDIKDPAFDALNTETWGLAPAERMVWGLGLHGGRLYYAVASGPDIWSIGINLDGSFGDDPRREIEVVGTPGKFPITDIAFDNQGAMFVAQRGGIQGSWDYVAFTEPKKSVVFRFVREMPDDPETSGTWSPVPEEYAVGFPPDYRNTSGGLALGYGYDKLGKVHQGTCGQMVWSSGNNLRHSDEFATKLAADGPTAIFGVQGNDRTLVRPDNEPPAVSYFVDYDGKSEDPDKSGHAGDVEIWQPCPTGEEEGAEFVYELPPWTGDTPPPLPAPDTFNLSVTKVAEPEECWAGGIGWQCGFTIRVTNTGNGFYFGDITLTDWLPDPPPGAVMQFWPQPPWNCDMISGTEYQCTHPSVGLYPGESVDLFVTVESPADDPRCYVDNAVQLDWAAGYGDSDLADDMAFASALVPSAPCASPPTEGEKSNLQIQKWNYGDTCAINGTDYICTFVVQATNTGPGVYNGAIEFDDTLSGAATTFVNSPSWTCLGGGSNFHCKHPDTTLNPGQSVSTLVGVVIPQTFGQCQLDNTVTITSPPAGSDQNVDGSDDSASASIKIPSEDCIGTETNLQLEKSDNPATCTAGPDSWTCGYTVKITSRGPGLFTGDIKFEDRWTNAPAGATLTPPANWTCLDLGAFPDFSCTTQNPVTLVPNDWVEAQFWIEIPATSGDVCTQSNSALLVQPAGGSPQNTDPGDDEGDATGTFNLLVTPSGESLCGAMEIKLKERAGPPPPPVKKNDDKGDEKDEPEPVCPTGWSKTPVPGKCCPHGSGWDGERCNRGHTPTDEPTQSELECLSGWAEIDETEDQYYTSRGYEVRQRREGNQTIWCATKVNRPEPTHLECWRGWDQIAANKTKSYINSGHKVRPRREGDQTIWCAKEEVRPEPTPLKCWSGWDEIGSGEVKAYKRKKGYEVKQRGEGDQIIWCAKEEMTSCPDGSSVSAGKDCPEVCPSNMNPVSSVKARRLKRRGAPVRQLDNGKWCAGAAPDQQCEQVWKDVCTVKPEKRCEKVTDKVCKMVPKQECHNTTKQICETKPERKCQNVTNNVCKMVPQCNNVWTKKCVYQPRVQCQGTGEFRECKTVNQQVCTPTTKKVCTNKQVCKPKTTTKCTTTNRRVCRPVNKRVCSTKMQRVCSPKTRTKCKTVKKRTCKRKRETVCK